MAEEEEEINAGGGEGGGDQFEETETEGYGSRISDSCGSICIGLLLIVCSIGAMIWNESNLVQARRALEESEKALVQLPSIVKVDPANEGKMVYVSGDAETSAALEDSMFGVKLNDSLRLQRSVSMYQWVQQKRTRTRKNIGGSKTRTTSYTYNKRWVNYHVDSTVFGRPYGHENPSEMAFDWKIFNADPITVGAFELSDIIVEEMDDFVALSSYSSSSVSFDVDNIPSTTTLKLQRKDFTITPYNGRGFFAGKGTSSNPQVGDVRITYSHVPNHQTLSIVAKQEGSTFGEYTTKNDRDIVLVATGKVKADDMFDDKNDDEKRQAWLIRGGAFVALWIALLIVVEPLSVLADVLPILGNLVDCVAFLVTGLLALCLSLITIALSWLVFRPLFSLCLFGGIAVIFVGLRLMGGGGNKKKGYEEISLTQDPEATKPSYTDAVVA